PAWAGSPWVSVRPPGGTWAALWGGCRASGPGWHGGYAAPVPAHSDTLVFLPAWNEEESLPAVLDELRSGLAQADVLVVDDGSTDRTAEVAREHGCEVISFGENRGLPAGIAAGYRYALERGYELCGRAR